MICLCITLHLVLSQCKWHAAGYLFGVIGQISDYPVYYLEEPDISSYGRPEAPKQPVYRVVFNQKDIWEGYAGGENDTLDIEIWQAPPDMRHPSCIHFRRNSLL